MTNLSEAELIQQYRLVHYRDRNYGTGAVKKCLPIIKEYCVTKPHSVLDFGCGKGDLVNVLKDMYTVVRGYDPAIPMFEILPNRQFDLILSFDVMEHLTLPIAKKTLSTIGGMASKEIILLIACRKAGQRLPNGMNAHTLVLQPWEWHRMMAKNMPGWVVDRMAYQQDGHKFIAHLVKEKPKKNKKRNPA